MNTRMELALSNVTRNIGWSVDGKSFREAEGVYHCMKSVKSISMLMIVCANFLDLTRISTKQEDTKVKILSTY